MHRMHTLPTRPTVLKSPPAANTATDLLSTVGDQTFRTLLADPPWRFSNRTGKVSPEHKRLYRYDTLSLDEIRALPIADLARETAHLYLWVPNALMKEGLSVMQHWGFAYKTCLIWLKVRKDGQPGQVRLDGSGVGFYFRNATELLLFGKRGKRVRTLSPARRQVNVILARKTGHSRKPQAQYPLIEQCSPGPFLELFARNTRAGWTAWGNEVPAPPEAKAGEAPPSSPEALASPAAPVSLTGREERAQ